MFFPRVCMWGKKEMTLTSWSMMYDARNSWFVAPAGISNAIEPASAAMTSFCISPSPQ